MQAYSAFQQGASRPPALSTCLDPSVTGARLRVLVVDDVTMNRDIAAAILRAGGHEAVCARDGAEAVGWVAEGGFDVVLMDLRMPVMDGFEAVRRIRNGRGPSGRVPIVALTAQSDPEQVEQCRRAGMNAHLGKPFDPATLLAAVEAVRTAHPTLPASVPPDSLAAKVLDRSTFQRPTFERTAALLGGRETTVCLRLLLARGEAMLCSLGEGCVSQPDEAALGEAAHMMAGSAGMFGFLQVAASARSLERDLAKAAPDDAAARRTLARAIGGMQAEIQRHLCQTVIQPTEEAS